MKASLPLALALAACAPKHGPPIEQMRIVDLTHALAPSIPSFNGKSPLSFETIVTVEKNGFYLNDVRITEHAGTHVDAPNHFVSGGPRSTACRHRSSSDA